MRQIETEKVVEQTPAILFLLQRLVQRLKFAQLERVALGQHAQRVLGDPVAFPNQVIRRLVELLGRGALTAEGLIGLIGQTLRVANLPFRVTGVMAKKGQDQQGRDQDDIAFAPYTTVQKT